MRRRDDPLPESLDIWARYQYRLNPDAWTRDTTEFLRAMRALREADPTLSESEALDALIATRRPVRKGDRPMVRRFSDIPREEIEWLWPGYLALGKLTLIAGDPGLGKSWLTLDIAARVSAGRSLPGDHRPTAGNVVILSAEDGAGDTLRPRLKDAGADLGRVWLLESIRGRGGTERTPSLRDDIPLIEQVIEDAGGIDLLVIDPVSAYLGGTDTHNNSDTRSALVPLCALADRHRFAVAAVSHLNKGKGRALQRTTGSIAFPALARVGLLVAEDPDDADRCILVATKANICRKQDIGLSYRIGGSPPRIQWGERDPRSADEIMAALDDSASAAPALREAEQWLRDALEMGPQLAKDMTDRANGDGINYRTLRRAKDTLGIVTRKRGMGGPWEWALPQEPGQ